MKYDPSNKSRKWTVRDLSPPSKEPTEMKRLTIDVPAHLHANFKAGCARQGVKMADAIRELLQERFGDFER